METIQKNEDKGPIIIKVKMAVSNNPHGIPPGTFLDILITIIDEYETIRTSNANFTEDLAKVAPKDAIAKYSPRLQKTIVKYPGKTMAEIAKIVGEDLKKIPTVS
jgi:hypothetical protein